MYVLRVLYYVFSPLLNSFAASIIPINPSTGTYSGIEFPDPNPHPFALDLYLYRWVLCHVLSCRIILIVDYFNFPAWHSGCDRSTLTPSLQAPRPQPYTPPSACTSAPRYDLFAIYDKTVPMPIIDWQEICNFQL